MQPIDFDTLGPLLEAGNAESVFNHLAGQSRASGDFGQMFEARMMAVRARLGLPLLAAGGPPADDQTRRTYDDAVMAAAREAGALFLEAGEISRAWPYFRALGDPAPVKAAIQAYRPDSDGADAIIEIALGEGVHPLRGLELVLGQHGTCRAITLFDQYPEESSREAALRLLVETLHSELRANLLRAIENHEGSPASGTIPELIAGREWLFGEFDYYVDTSHLISVLRFALDSADPATLAMAIEMARYGEKLAPMFHHRGDPPLDDVYVDHRIWLQAIAGEDEEGAVAHFRAKVDALDLDQTGTYPAQVLVRFLLRLKRHGTAVEVFEKYLTETDPAYLSCPGLAELFRMAQDWPRLRRLARQRGDAITFAAASLMNPSSPA